MKQVRTAQPNLSIRKGFDVLEALAFSPVPLTTGQVSEKLGLDKSVASRMLLTLGELGYVQRVGRGVWRSSTGLMALSLMGMRNSPLVHVRPMLVELQARVRCIVALGFVWKEQVVYVYHSGDPDQLETEGMGHVFPAAESSIGQLLMDPGSPGHRLVWLQKRTRFSLAVPVVISGLPYGLAVSGAGERYEASLIPMLQGFAAQMRAGMGGNLP